MHLTDGSNARSRSSAGASRLFTGLLGAGQVVLSALDPGPRPGDRLNHRGLGGVPGRAERVAARLPSHLLVPRIFRRMVKYRLW